MLHFNQFSKLFQISKIASDKTANTLKQIQKQLTQASWKTIGLIIAGLKLRND